MKKIFYAIAAVFIVATFVMLWVVHSRHAVLWTVLHHDDAWEINKTIQELLRLESEIGFVLAEGTSGFKDELQLRIDIAASRMSSLERGNVREFIDQDPDRLALVAGLAQTIDDISRSNSTQNIDALRSSFEELRVMSGPVVRLSSQAVQQSWTDVERNFNDILWYQKAFALVIVFLVLTWCSLLYILVRQNNTIEQSRIKSDYLNHSLKVAADELSKRHEQLAYQANHDALSQLPNRFSFLNTLERLLGSEQSAPIDVSLMLIDLDKFKAVNDTWGHDAGDLLLKSVSARLRNLDDRATLISRLGGDEFACILTNKSHQEILDFSMQVYTKISNPYQIFGRKVDISCSIGVVKTNVYIDSVKFMKNADIALYNAKQSYSNRICLFDEDLDIKSQRIRDLELDLRLAVNKKDINVFYQMQVDIHTLEVRGMEALARWNHPIHGNINPQEFISISENSGLIHELGAVVLEKACAQAAEWNDNIKIAVNISPIQLHSDTFFNMVMGIVSSSGINPNRLELEITESIFANSNEEVIATLRLLRNSGVSIAIDDFGTGYSSLARLRSIPFDTIKIDRQFLSDITKDVVSGEFLKIVTSIGDLLGKEIIIEGIETISEYEVIKKLHFDSAQGYFFAKPIPAERLIDLSLNKTASLRSIEMAELTSLMRS